jgi:hypothetical protein
MHFLNYISTKEEIATTQQDITRKVEHVIASARR